MEKINIEDEVISIINKHAGKTIGGNEATEKIVKLFSPSFKFKMHQTVKLKADYIKNHEKLMIVGRKYIEDNNLKYNVYNLRHRDGRLFNDFHEDELE